MFFLIKTYFWRKFGIMALIIREICKEKGMSMSDLAAKLGITPVSLSQCLSGNPSLKRLEEIASVLEVDVFELFERAKKSEVQGCVFVNGEPHLIKSMTQLKELVEKIDSTE